MTLPSFHEGIENCSCRPAQISRVTLATVQKLGSSQLHQQCSFPGVREAWRAHREAEHWVWHLQTKRKANCNVYKHRTFIHSFQMFCFTEVKVPLVPQELTWDQEIILSSTKDSWMLLWSGLAHSQRLVVHWTVSPLCWVWFSATRIHNLGQ